jgi:hypothetical protein
MNGGHDAGWIEMVLPLEQLDVQNLRLESPRRLRSNETDIRYERTILPLSYEAPSFKMPCFAVLTPFMKVHAWDSTSGRLEFELEHESVAYTHIKRFENHIIALLLDHASWLEYRGGELQDHIERSMQYSIVGNIFTIYLHGQNLSNKPMGRVWGWKQGAWIKGAAPTTFKKGQQLRVAIRFQGICFFPNAPAKSKYRIQHQTIAVYYKDP